MDRLAGRVALITGAAKGIGLAITERFIAEGAQVLIADIDDEAGRAVAEAHPGVALFQPLDVADDDDWTAAVDALQQAFGPLTTLVNNAGINFGGSIANATLEHWRRTMDVNAQGTFLGCRHAVRAMAQGGGTIINIASANGRRASPNQLAYSASKALMLSLTECVALHCGAEGLAIRCNAICPGVIETPLMAQHLATLGDETLARQRLAAMQILGRIGQPGEVADAAVFLASEESSFMTGAIIDVDGGYRLR
jgi:3alpha(or 20beta)-hydroxysteroid dehydrogenase